MVEMNGLQRLQVIDSHTGGEPTRVVVGGGPALRGTMSECRELLRNEFDWVRTTTILEPRGSDVLVGAILCEPVDPSCAAGVVFFNNAGYLHMCGHGTIGVAVTLFHMGRVGVGKHRLETPVGIVGIECHDKNRVTIENVPSYRLAAGMTIDVPDVGPVSGDIAWGGNWFFLCGKHGLDLALANVERLTDYTWRVRQELTRRGITGAGGQEIDHIELFGPPKDPKNYDSNFVLCPGRAYDSSPCGHWT